MNKHFRDLFCIVALTAAAAVTAAPAEKSTAQGESTKTAPAEAPVPKSNFTVPTKAEEGRDPFFPGSDRLFGSKAAPTKARQTANVSSLVFNGISGTHDRPLAMINGHTFAEGEEAIVNTSSGRVHIRCLDINGDTAVIEANGERRELRFQDR